MKRLKWFVVTNKHVLGKVLDKNRPRSIMFYPLVGPQQGQIRDVCEIVSHDRYSAPIIYGHPDPNVDILLLDVTAQVLNNTLIFHEAPGTEAFYLPSSKATVYRHVSPGMPVCIIGYPNLNDGQLPFDLQYTEPAVYSGTVATSLDRPYIENGKERPGFLLNATVIPGHSGSPVILDPREPLVVDGRHYLGKTMPPLLLGIIAETRFGNVKAPAGQAKAFGGAAFAYSAETILQTLQSPILI